MLGEKVDYNKLNSKQKENYNFHKVASALADYGYDSMRLNNDWQGADFIAVKNDEMLKIQLKGKDGNISYYNNGAITGYSKKVRGGYENYDKNGMITSFTKIQK